jgi:hypothetical protein
MKHLIAILKYLTILTIATAVAYTIYNTKPQPIQPQINLTQTNIRPLLDKIEELTELKVRLLQEVADQDKQIKEFGWLKESMDKEGVNP